MTAERVTADDLHFAAQWVESYEAGPDDENGESIERVAAWLRAEAARIETREVARVLAARVNRKPSHPLVKKKAAEIVASGAGASWLANARLASDRLASR